MAQAQDCTIRPTAIIDFRLPEFSTPIVWKGSVAEAGSERFVDAVSLADESLIAGGTYTARKEAEKTQPLLVRMKRRGEIMWQVRGESGSPQSIEQIIKNGNDIITLGGIGGDDNAPASVIVGRYDENGKRQGGFGIAEPEAHLYPAAIIPVKGGGYYIAARYQNLKEKSQKHGVIFRLDAQGKTLWRRAYIPGLTTAIDSMIALKNGDLLIGGSVKSDAGRISGWLLRLDGAGSLQWQRSYPRGRSAEFTRLMEASDGYLIGGISWPANAEKAAAWIMKVDTGGNMVWERYYKGVDDYRVVDMGLLNDGRIVTIIGARPGNSGEDIPLHTRLIILSPRGDLLDAESITDGDGLSINRLLNADGMPLLIGSVRMSQASPKPNTPKIKGVDAWIGELQSIAAYDDPCRQ